MERFRLTASFYDVVALTPFEGHMRFNARQSGETAREKRGKGRPPRALCIVHTLVLLASWKPAREALVIIKPRISGQHMFLVYVCGG